MQNPVREYRHTVHVQIEGRIVNVDDENVRPPNDLTNQPPIGDNVRSADYDTVTRNPVTSHSNRSYNVADQCPTYQTYEEIGDPGSPAPEYVEVLHDYDDQSDGARSPPNIQNIPANHAAVDNSTRQSCNIEENEEECTGENYGTGVQEVPEDLSMKITKINDLVYSEETTTQVCNFMLKIKSVAFSSQVNHAGFI